MLLGMRGCAAGRVVAEDEGMHHQRVWEQGEGGRKPAEVKSKSTQHVCTVKDMDSGSARPNRIPQAMGSARASATSLASLAGNPR